MSKGLNVIDGKLEITDVIERLKEMRPECKCPKFDESKADIQYCVEWGRLANAEFERSVYNRYINELTELSKKKPIIAYETETNSEPEMPKEHIFGVSMRTAFFTLLIVSSAMLFTLIKLFSNGQ